jgi:hypothetical protein
MRRAVLVLGVLLTLAVTSVAEAGRSYWSERKAERRLTQRYGDVVRADCLGIGYDWRIRRGVEVYRGFYCWGPLTGADEFEVIVTVTGKRAFKVTPY